jgi:hypothetical protein
MYSFIDWLIIKGFTSRSRIFHLYEDVIIAGEGLQNLGLCSALRAFEQGEIFIVPHLLWHGPPFFRSHPKDRPNQTPLTTHMGMWRSILTRILTGTRRIQFIEHIIPCYLLNIERILSREKIVWRLFVWTVRTLLALQLLQSSTNLTIHHSRVKKIQVCLKDVHPP